jgi:hypothetical protein
MLIVCTHDTAIRDWAADPRSGSAAWGEVKMLSGRFSKADDELRRLIRSLGNEPLCLDAHGNDDEIGDARDDGWGWSHQVIADMFADRTALYPGPILVSACANRVVNFSANLAVSLGRCHIMAGVWIYGYNRALGIGTQFPDPQRLDRNAALQGTRVPWVETADV